MPDTAIRQASAASTPAERTDGRAEARADAIAAPPFERRFAELFERHFRRLHRYLQRLSGEPELAADLAQETFVRLYRRGAAPDAPEAWLITVATNLFRNARTSAARRTRLLAGPGAEAMRASEPASPSDDAERTEECRHVRATIARLPERDRRMLLLLAEGYRYRDIAAALGLHEASVGTLLARAKRAFRDLYEDEAHASRE